MMDEEKKMDSGTEDNGSMGPTDTGSDTSGASGNTDDEVAGGDKNDEAA